MRASAVICECNPLHSGHKYIFDKAHELSDVVIGIMSGNFTQRSEAAIFDKYTRARDLLNAGVDLVLELPFPWSSASGEFFARAGVSIANSIGAGYLVFGSESGSIDELNKALELANSNLDNELRIDKTLGAGYLRDKVGKENNLDFISSSNNQLAMNYIREINNSKCDMKPITHKLVETKKASIIREELIENISDIEEYKTRVENKKCADNNKLFNAERQHLTLNKDIDFDSIFDAGQGVGKRIQNMAIESKDGLEMLEKSATKKYTNSRLRRVALYSTVGLENFDIRKMPKYSVLLGANEKGRAYLKEINLEDFFIVTKPSDTEKLSSDAKNQYDILLKADRLYAISYASEMAPNHFIKESPVII